MSDSPTRPAETGEKASEASQPDEAVSGRPASTPRAARLVRWSRRFLAVCVAVVAGLLVAVFTLDLSTLYPGLTVRAEQFASKQLKRSMHIGAISALITPGDFVIENVRIEGLTPADRPFFAAKRIFVHLPWWRMFAKRLDVEVEIDDWQMAVETWEGGRHSLPNLKFGNDSGQKGWFSRTFITTVRFAYARHGGFFYHDHATPWSIEAKDLEFSLVRAYSLNKYVGLARFSSASTQIQQFLPMATTMSTRFVLDGGKAHLEHLDLDADGSVSHITGDVDFRNWPDQTYYVKSTVDFRRLREIFFAKETWLVTGEGEFTGMFRYPKDGRRELTGEFTSNLASVNRIEFGDLHGALQWTRELFAVTHADADVLGGQTRFQYALAPLGTKTGARATFSADYVNVDLFELDRLVTLRGLKLRGTANGSLAMAWPNGRFRTGVTGDGHTIITPSGTQVIAEATLPVVPRAVIPEPQKFDGAPRSATLTIAADLHYRFDSESTTFDKSVASTPFTYVGFEGRLAHEGESSFPFHVTSHDWQESDRLLAAVMSAIGGPTGAVEVGGRGTFDGIMTGRFSSPRITGHFTGDRVRAWGVTWGPAVAEVAIEGGYVTISKGRIGDQPGVSIVPDGRFSLGFRKDDGEEINASITITNWPVADLKHAFVLDDWAMDGTVDSAELKLRGKYRTMFGGGPVRIVRGSAWGEQFERATANVELEGTGMGIRALEIRKSETGLVRGYANVVWPTSADAAGNSRPGTYGFDVTGEGIPVDTLDNFKSPRAPLTGQLTFKASGVGRFESPTYAVEGSIQDLFVGDEGIGPVTGRLSVANNVLTIERLLATSPRLVGFASGTIALDDHYTSNLSVRFQNTSLHPYLKFVLANEVSPYTRIEATGAVAVNGPLSDPLSLVGTATVDEASITLSDYKLTNDGPVQLALNRGALSIGAFKLKGTDTNLALTGGADARARTYGLNATGSASLAILQLFYKGLTASGAATLNAGLTGSVEAPQLSGQATIVDGYLRPLDSPHGLEAINGSVTFAAGGIRLESLRGRVGTGDVVFGGNISLDGYSPDEFNLTAQGRSMRLRYPAGFTSTVDMNLFLTGSVTAPRLSGDVDVLRMSYLGEVNADASLLSRSGTPAPPTNLIAPPSAIGIPVTLDIQVTAPRTMLVDTRTAKIEGQADLQVRGTFDQPQILGAVDVLGGEYQFNGNRIFVRRGSIDFTHADRLEPVFDISAETRARVTGQTFNVNIELSGTFSNLHAKLSSDPWLPETEIVTLLFGGSLQPFSVEQRALTSSQELQERMFRTAGAVLLTQALTSRVGDVFERTGALDTVQITPLLTGESAFQQLNASARITLGKRISPRVFLTYSRTFNTQQEEVILLEYDQSDRLSWVLSRNEDRSYALDFRIRYVF